MKLVRDLERRLEQLVEGVAGRVFRGTLHPTELAARLVREADLARRDGPDGPVAPNVYAIHLSPKDVGELEVPDQLNRELEYAVEVEAAARGWRLEGPTRVWMESHDSVSAGRLVVKTEVSPGERRPWGLLAASNTSYYITHNRAIIGRSTDADVTIPDSVVSRRHAMIWREADSVWIADQGSSNGTYVEGASATTPIVVANGQRITLGSLPVQFQLVGGAG